MPELPEVEIVRQSLNKKIKQKKVKKVIVRNRNLRFKIPSNFESFLTGYKIIKVERYSKYLILCLSNARYCLLHLGMSGTVHIVNNDKKNLITNTSFYSLPILPKKHNHVEIIFQNFRVIYNDPRRFGFFQLIDNEKILKKRFSNLGPEPFQSNFNLDYLFSFFKGKKRNIKNFLLDQKFISGIGNIYASEILFLSKINPNKHVSKLKKSDCRKIIINSKKVLNNAIKKGGSSIRDFKNTSGKKGNFQKNFNVYERSGLKCKRFDCNGVIQKKMISNRSSYFCNFCQI
jgi:formamidopyrimidine-DNA glycosylase|tara:strand:+ start:1069 stop:1932 length:864 start_codon:yes stop_codon:yes gene_type:complete